MIVLVAALWLAMAIVIVNLVGQGAIIPVLLGLAASGIYVGLRFGPLSRRGGTRR
jgi:hypothetical protein